MTLYFRIASGAHALLMDSRHVAQADLRQVAPDAETAPWRDCTLPVVDLARALGHQCTAAHQLVLADSRGVAASILLVDRIEGIVDIAEEAFLPAAPLNGTFERHFNGVWYDPVSAVPRLRLRHPFGWESIRS